MTINVQNKSEARSASPSVFSEISVFAHNKANPRNNKNLPPKRSLYKNNSYLSGVKRKPQQL